MPHPPTPSSPPLFSPFFQERSHSTARTSALPDAQHVCAVVENRAREVGLAAFNLGCPEIVLSQFQDNANYINTITLLHVYQPQEVLAVNLDSKMLGVLKTQIGCRVTMVGRKYWNENAGLAFLQRTALEETNTVEFEVSTKYLCLAALNAVSRYVEFTQGVSFATESLRIVYRGLKGRVLIDWSSVEALEIVFNSVTGNSTTSLFGLFPIQSAAGARMLRANLLQPLNDLPTLQLRLDCVQELIQNEELLLQCRELLPQFADLDHLLSQIVRVTKEPNSKTAEQAIRNVVNFHRTIKLLPGFCEAIGSSKNALLQKVAENMGHPCWQQLQEALVRVLDGEGTTKATAPRSAQQQHMAYLFAVKPGLNGLLDVARKAYAETIDEMYSLVEEYAHSYDLSGLRIAKTARRGHHLVVPAKIAASHIPAAFVERSKSGKGWVCTTERLASLNQRNQESEHEIFLLTGRIIEDLLCEIRQCISFIYTLSESIALLDLVVSFARLAQEKSDYEFTPDGPMVIKQGRHPLVEDMVAAPFAPNDTWASSDCNFQLITGPNFSGKTTYLKQVAVLNIIAQIGSYVPATYASFRVVDRICTCLCAKDGGAEANTSSFFREMKEMAFALQVAADRSLVIVDELGRGTSTADALGIAWAMAESLLTRGTYTFFATHLLQLTELASLYPNVKIHKLIVETRGNEIIYNHTLAEGLNSIRTAINLAEIAGLPISLVHEARMTSEQLRHATSVEQPVKSTQTRANSQLVQRLLSLRHSTLNLEGLLRYLTDLKTKFLES